MNLTSALRGLGAKEGQYMTLVLMEYCDAGNLLRVIDAGMFSLQKSSWNIRVVTRALLRTAIEIAQGMMHLHQLDIIHGDLKP
eukprot:CAMPEP_0175084056 /NCGR_PEP_ID=MMETSP0052_2-20121109/27802_1 /TAXON_ID=51329 ORGANISM="Polytomella parva, Strain SAG 63-3" /NCGR_SAMPLE_ID=MMETSP0052_2 /ASSEMBLY_ACC=CAM_ASM_000194 /LENGTH=82 /DNA_ID=CAMNT_0016355727 /DNA_START=140 /DNA_END=385 /DNA_ORIENTATION=+